MSPLPLFADRRAGRVRGGSAAARRAALLLLALAGASTCRAPGGAGRDVPAASLAEMPAPAPPSPSPSPGAPDDGRHRGVCWVGGDLVTEEHLRPLLEAHVTWISQTPFGWMRRADEPEVRLVTSGVYWGETDEGIETTARLARRIGLRTLLKPDIWLTRPEPGTWRADVAMQGEEDWRLWWEGYRDFILHYARLAESAGIDALSVGTELRAAATRREADWRRLIAEVRGVFRGELTYAANWHREYEEVAFWDALDYIGVQAYFPLAEEPDVELDALRERWRDHLDAIERVQRTYGKPVLFTEIGYRSDDDAAIEPWRWPRAPSPLASQAGLKAQEDCYRAFFESAWEKEWLAGAYLWKWHPHHRPGSAPVRADFSPQGKPAYGVLAEWFGRRVR